MKRSIILARTPWIFLLLFIACSQGASQLTWYWRADSYVIAPGYSPRVVRLKPARWDGGYHCWYSISTTGGYDIYHALSTDGVDWLSQWGGGPVLRRGSTGDFDAVWAIDPCVIALDSQLVMYYTGYDGTKYQTGAAFSDDGIHWTKYAGNPVLRVGTGWESIVAASREVIENPPGSAQRFTMYYVGYDGVVWRTGAAFSDNGLTWTRFSNNPILDVGSPGTWDQYGASINTIVFDQGIYYMFYQTRKPSFLGIATSTDRVTWTKYRRNPILDPPFEGTSLGYGSMLLEDGMLRYWFSLESSSWGICYAVSSWNPDVITGMTNAATPHHAVMYEAYPNPFNPSTTIRYQLPESRDVRLSVYDLLGREVAVLVNERNDAGVHEVRFDGSGLASGMYLYRLTAGSFTQTRRLLLLR